MDGTEANIVHKITGPLHLLEHGFDVLDTYPDSLPVTMGYPLPHYRFYRTTLLMMMTQHMNKFPAQSIQWLIGLLYGMSWAGLLQAEAAETVPLDEIYHDYCSVCHGDRGDGRSRAMGSMQPPPADFTRPGAALELTRERMLVSIREGRPGTAMTAWKTQLSDTQIEAVTDFIRERFMLPVAGEEGSEGARLYAENCSVCHGDQGRTAVWAENNMQPAPRDFTAELAASELTRERMVRSVTFGRPDTAMAGFRDQLAPAQIEAVVDYIRTAFMGQGADSSMVEAAPVRIDMELPFTSGLVGDPVRGQAFYLQNCVACHGERGDGQGPRAYFILPKPRDFTLEASRATLNRPVLYEAIAKGRRGAEMPAWETVLDAQTMTDIAEYVFQTFIRLQKAGS